MARERWACRRVAHLTVAPSCGSTTGRARVADGGVGESADVRHEHGPRRAHDFPRHRGRRGAAARGPGLSQCEGMRTDHALRSAGPPAGTAAVENMQHAYMLLLHSKNDFFITALIGQTAMPLET
eukprot:scaffold76978_cov37-Prasinocladus_malaysianus.AAC.1